MSSLLQRLRGDIGGPQRQPTDPPVRKGTGSSGPPRDPNVPKKRLQIHQRCLYERTLPGNAFISAHVNRLQHGYYESTALHEPVIDNLFFVSVHFVFHPYDPRSHRFKSAEIQVCVHGDDDSPSVFGDSHYRAPSSHPRILQHAPRLMFGAVSPENLQWNFSLSSSLGISQAPVAATLNPTGGMNGSYKVYHMMSIQGSVRSKRSPFGPQFDVEDAMAVWTLEENMLQRSGLPREFDFVLLVQNPDDVKNVYLTVDVDADIEAWYGTYPKWYTNLQKYSPSQDFTLDFNADIGQKFLPTQAGRGFNFASLSQPLDEYVTMPGTVYPTNDTQEDEPKQDAPKRFGYKLINDDKAIEASPISPQHPVTPQRRVRSPAQSSQNRRSWAPENMNVRVVLEHQYPPGSDPRRFSYSPLSNQEPTRYPSIRRRKSRTGLKEYGAKQALHELAQNELQENAQRSPSGGKVMGMCDGMDATK